MESRRPHVLIVINNMGERKVYTKVTPLSHDISRQLALDMLHSHGKDMSLNLLVKSPETTGAPCGAEADDYFAQCYGITKISTWGSGTGIKKSTSFERVLHGSSEE
jgi:hypothetical protein